MSPSEGGYKGMHMAGWVRAVDAYSWLCCLSPSAEIRIHQTSKLFLFFFSLQPSGFGESAQSSFWPSAGDFRS